MRKRTGQLWAMVGGFAIIMLLVSACHPEFGAGSATGMAAPSAPRTSFESAPLDKLLQSHFDGCGASPETNTFELTRLSVCLVGSDGFDSPAVQHYGPLYRRPPASLS
jgi:hypothetical protein